MNLGTLKVGAIFITYNQECYVSSALKSLLEQNKPFDEIIISDDCSTDKTYSILKKIVGDYKGPTKIVLNQSPTNVGIGRNTQIAFDLSKADILVTCDGDDISRNDRVEKTLEFFGSQDAIVNLLVTDAYSMTKDGMVTGIKCSNDLQDIQSFHTLLNNPPLFFGATTAFRRILVSQFGEISTGVSAVDQIMISRSLLAGRAHTLHEPLVYHRLGGVTGFESKNVYQKIDRLRKDSFRTISDISQILQDSKGFKLTHLVEGKFRKNFLVAKYVQKLFNERIFSKKLKIFICSRGVPLSKKIRFFSYATIPGLLNFIWDLKKHLGMTKST